MAQEMTTTSMRGDSIDRLVLKAIAEDESKRRGQIVYSGDLVREAVDAAYGDRMRLVRSRIESAFAEPDGIAEA